MRSSILVESAGERLLVGPSDLRRTWYSDAFFYYLFPELTPATYFPSHFSRNLKFLYGSKRCALTVN